MLKKEGQSIRLYFGRKNFLKGEELLAERDWGRESKEWVGNENKSKGRKDEKGKRKVETK